MNEIKDILITASILVLMAVRYMTKTATWMGSVTLAGLLVAFIALYSDLKEEYKYYDAFITVRGIFIVIFFVIIVFLMLTMTGSITIPPFYIDELTFTLMVSLPKKVYFLLMKKIVRVE